ncbi:hypothetical protein [Hymenobacter nivis]|uniref:DUF4168 domain-containing protein n=1 Tax=Hymenobacter nivis TaxID=1850093 RepID=A0A2Z3GK07_9BACT|nr:hypothetical protein [Hymenobacter nivis]AWM32372.1 hypothetical protein DDQ68_05930 [Hymenobacter nivis]
MKAKISVLLVLFALAYVPARAQFVDRTSIERAVPNISVFNAEATALTRQMANSLHLNEGQYAKLFNVNRTRVAQLGEINTYFKPDEPGRATRLSELDAQYDQECSRILSPSQLAQLHQEKGAPVMPADTGNGRG